jgi:segregation and condensation protein B
MLTDETLKAVIEGIIYVASEPVTIESMGRVLEGEERDRVKAKLDELVAEYEQNGHGIQIRQVASGYKFSTKAEHHEILRKYVKSLKAPVKLSKPALETLAVIAYRQPVTVPEIEEVRGVDSGGVIHTLLEKKLVMTSGRKNVVGRPILYRTSKDFLVHFGLKDVSELPSLKEFEELAKRALGSQWAAEAAPEPTGEPAPVAAEATAEPGAESVAPSIDASEPGAREGTAETPPDAEIAPLEVPSATEPSPVSPEAGSNSDFPTEPLPEPVQPGAGEPAPANAGNDTGASEPEVEQPGAAEPLLTDVPPAPASDPLGSALPEPRPEPPAAGDWAARNDSTEIAKEPDSEPEKGSRSVE